MRLGCISSQNQWPSNKTRCRCGGVHHPSGCQLLLPFLLSLYQEPVNRSCILLVPSRTIVGILCGRYFHSNDRPFRSLDSKRTVRRRIKVRRNSRLLVNIDPINMEVIVNWVNYTIDESRRLVGWERNDTSILVKCFWAIYHLMRPKLVCKSGCAIKWACQHHFC